MLAKCVLIIVAAATAARLAVWFRFRMLPDAPWIAADGAFVFVVTLCAVVASAVFLFFSHPL